MPKNKSASNNTLNKYLRLQIINLIIYVTVFAVVCCISLAADLQKDYMLYASLVFIGASSFISGFTAGIKERKNGLLCGVLSSLPLNVSVIIIALICNKLSADINLLLNAVTGLLLSAAGGIVSVNIRLK